MASVEKATQNSAVPPSGLNTEENTLPQDELFQIIDESGEGLGFDLTPEALAKPFAIGAASVFSLGMLAGVPMGLVMGRSQESKGTSRQVRPSLDGVKFAATTFGLGTLLCGAMGVASFYGLKSFYEVESFEEFGLVMREVVPQRRAEMETSLGPVLKFIRRNAGDNLPGPMKRLREKFLQSRLGVWIKEQVDISVIGENQQNTSSDKQFPEQDRSQSG
ncbi:hypothetical protein FGB62_22g130 [Gracilaria domingensis]|nr:hypothetical protein FGB62_22g130 [Gracilaria domingensis]